MVGLVDAESDAERISEEIKTKLDSIPVVNLEFKEVDGKKLVLLHVYKGQETPYYYIGDKQRLAFKAPQPFACRFLSSLKANGT